jgi:hypothetical protein
MAINRNRAELPVQPRTGGSAATVKPGATRPVPRRQDSGVSTAATTLPKGQGLARGGSGLGTGPVGRSSGTSQPVTRPATPSRLRKPSAGLNPVKPATQTQGRKKNDPWNSPW